MELVPQLDNGFHPRHEFLLRLRARIQQNSKLYTQDVDNE